MIIKRTQGGHIHWGPWRLGRSGLWINIASACFLTISIVFSFFPPALPVTPVSMNWSVVVFMGSIFVGLIYYGFHGRHVYHGPVVERPIIVTHESDL